MTEASTLNDEQLTDVPAEDMERSYLEYRKACYHALFRHSQERGLMRCLEKPSDLSEIATEMNFSPTQQPTLELLMAALARYGVVVHSEDGKFSAASGEGAASLDVDEALVARASGSGSLDDLLHGNSYPGIIDSLFENQNRVASAFVEKNLPVWDEFLSTPFYRYNRVRAARRMCRPGARVADIACGPGFGLRECADLVTDSGVVHGIEISSGFAAAAVQRSTDRENVVVTRQNVDGDGLSFVADGALDGAMMVGAFHFLTDQATFLDHMKRILRPGSPLCLSYVYMHRGSYDQQLTDIRFHLRHPKPYPRNENDLARLVTDHGFALDSSYTMGCYQSFVFTA